MLCLYSVIYCIWYELSLFLFCWLTGRTSFTNNIAETSQVGRLRCDALVSERSGHSLFALFTLGSNWGSRKHKMKGLEWKWADVKSQPSTASGPVYSKTSFSEMQRHLISSALRLYKAAIVTENAQAETCLLLCSLPAYCLVLFVATSVQFNSRV